MTPRTFRPPAHTALAQDQHPRQVSRRRRMPLRGSQAAALTAAVTAAVTAAASCLAAASPPARDSAPPPPARLAAHAAPRQAVTGTEPAPAMRAGCPAPEPGDARCFALYSPQTPVNRAIAAGITGPAAQPDGWSPQAIESAYKLPVSRNSRQTVAVSIAFDTPKLARYLALYRSHYGLPPCTTARGCLRIVNQSGKPSPLPPSGVGTGWGLEATLDVSMISVTCPHCHILVVEGHDNSVASLAATENTAARLGAAVISNSYGAQETGAALASAAAYHHPRHTIVASSGDSGFTAAQFPADLATVTAVGGTELARSRGSRGFTETVWNQPAIGGASGSGCSPYVPKPAWQHDRHCPGRTVADVAALAAGVPIYNTDYGGWVTVAGTSISAPLIAGVYALAANATTIPPGYTYQHASHLFDITTGDNALFATPRTACGRDYLCTAKPGYDAPTGTGTPDGTGSF